MTDMPPADMAEATRLTRAGRLTEATALIQRLLGGGATAPAPEATAHQPGLVHRLLDRLKELGAGLGLGGHARPEAAVEPAGGSFVAASFTNAAGTRAYKLFVPGAAGTRPLPLVVMLHGCTQTPDDFAAGTRMNLLAEELGCYIAYPQQSAKANVQRCWNWFMPGDQARGAGEPSLVAGITREVMAQHRVDPSRVYVAGMSAGGALAAVMAATYPDLFAAVGIHSGLACGVARDVPSALTAMRSGPNGATPVAAGPTIPAILFHGDQDQTVNPVNGDRIVQQVLGGTAPAPEIEQGRSVGGLSYDRARYRDADGSVRLERWTVHGSGHAWSGGSPDGSYTDPRGPDASREMLRFFLGTARRPE